MNCRKRNWGSQFVVEKPDWWQVPQYAGALQRVQPGDMHVELLEVLNHLGSCQLLGTLRAGSFWETKTWKTPVMVHYGIMVSARIVWRFAAGFCPCDEIYFNTSWPKRRGRKQRTSWHLRTHTHTTASVKSPGLMLLKSIPLWIFVSTSATFKIPHSLKSSISMN